ncbi:FecR family protein [Luteimonas aquatica]|uniref:FecR family protein n=1 Tax=Luteimonas aquatica TaxID=450364 RepID=UPI001F56449D|nr:FecR domain-containing protein [Luteimonas aquatica]
MESATGGLDEAAARWSELLRGAGEDWALRRDFESWRMHSLENAAAFRRVEAAHALASAVADAPEMQALRRETLARAVGVEPPCRRWPRNAAVAASLLAAVTLGLLAVNPEGSRRAYHDARDMIAGNVYQTGVGQRSVVSLDDGSVVTLNTDSRISVHYGDGIRGITLERGQALFKVAKDRRHPFVVRAGGREVTALGTEFDVHVSDKAFEVTLLEGRVTVTPERERPAAGAPDKPAAPLLAELHPGQQFVAVAKAAPQVRATDVRRVVSWRTGQIVFENERLDDAVAEMNRYSRRQVVLSDARLASLKISGAFNTGDTDTFVNALSDYFPIEHNKREDDTIVLRPQRPSRG